MSQNLDRLQAFLMVRVRGLLFSENLVQEPVRIKNEVRFLCDNVTSSLFLIPTPLKRGLPQNDAVQG